MLDSTRFSRFLCVPSSLGRLLVASTAILLASLVAACDEEQPQLEELLQRGQDALQRGDVQASLIQAKNVLQRDPNHAEARFLLGNAYLEAGNGKAALEQLERAQKLGFDPIRLLAPKARAYILTGDVISVMGLRVDPDGLTDEDRAFLHAARGYVHVSGKDFEKARAAFDRALNLKPKLELALLGYARCAVPPPQPG